MESKTNGCQDERQKIIADIASLFVSNVDFSSRMQAALALIGEHTGVSRVYLFNDNDEGTATSNTFEWCGPGITPQIDELQDVPYDLIPSWKKILRGNGLVHSENIRELPEDIRVILEPQGILSIVVYPVFIKNEIRGFIGFDECARQRRWELSDLELLRTLSGIVSSACERELVREQLARSEENYRALFDTIDDLIIIGDLDGNIIHTNDAVTSTLGYDRTALAGMHILDLHPPEKIDEARSVLESMFRGERDTCPLELRTASGGIIPVETRIWYGNWNNRKSIFGLSKNLTKEQQALQKFYLLFENNPAPMAISAIPDGTFTDINGAFLERFKYDRSAVIGKTSADLGLLVSPEIQREVSRELRETGHIRDVELEVRCRDGTILRGLFSGEIIDNQGVKSFLTVMVDITEITALRESVESQKVRLENIIEGTRLGTWEWNVQTGETIFNDRWAEIIGCRLNELEPVSIDTWMAHAHPDDLEQSNDLLQKHFSGQSEFYEYECRMRHRDGRWIWVHDRGKVIQRDPQGKPLWMFGTHSDITEKKALEEELKNIAIRDPLTGLFNRRHMFERLDEIHQDFLRTGRLYAVTILDIDHFKNINDTRGHRAGDHVLAEFARSLVANVRKFDLVGRYGGEEFIVVSNNSSRHQANTTITRILEAIRECELHFDGHRIRFTFSAGVADSGESDAASQGYDYLLERADTRLYEAKNAGRNRIVI